MEKYYSKKKIIMKNFILPYMDNLIYIKNNNKILNKLRKMFMNLMIY